MITDGFPDMGILDDALLRESAEELYEHAPCGYLYTMPDGAIIKTNSTFLAWSGFDRRELVGTRRFIDLLTVGGKLFYETHFTPLLRMHGLANEIAFDLIRKDGRRFAVLINALEKYDALGQPLFRQITVFNAEERRRYERELLHAKQAAEQAARDLAELNAALRRSEEAVLADRDRLRQVLDVLPVAVLLADPARYCTMANAAARAMLGYDPAEPSRIGGPVLDTIALRRPDGTPYPVEDLPWHHALDHKASTPATEALIGAVGGTREIAVLIVGAPLTTPAGAVAGVVTIFQDVTILKDLERAREEFLGSAAHDLKSPITAMRGLAQLARRRLTRIGLPDPAPIMEHLKGIEAGADRMVALINELTDITHLHTGALLELHRVPSDLLELCRLVVERQHIAASHRITLETTVPELQADIDSGRMERVLTNLLGNAVKYTPEGGDITLSVSREEADGTAWAVLTVRDTGIGIPPADLPHIFERYYRAGNVVGRIQGTGIGLAGVRQIVEQHGGTVQASSRVNEGTTVLVRIPLRTMHA